SSLGTQTITANGVTNGMTGSGIVSDTDGTRTITVGTAGNVTGGQQAVLLTGAGAGFINNSGIIGGLTNRVAVNSGTAGATTVTNSAGGTVNGQLLLSDYDDSFSNLGTFNLQGTSDFGDGADLFVNNPTGTINLINNTTLNGLETFTQNGTLNLNTFTLTGSPGTLTNNGTINTTGSARLAGFTALSNAGTLNLAAGTFTAPIDVFTNSGTLNAVNGATTIIGQANFANSGLINLQDGAPNDVLTINSDFVGSGGSTLAIDASNTAADRLVITGNASGSTTLNATVVGAGPLNIPGNLVVDTNGSTPNAFTLGTVTGITASPLVNYALVQRGTDYFLAAAPSAAAFDPLAVGKLASSIWYQSADEVQSQTDLPAVTVGASLWGQAYYSHDKVADRDNQIVLQGTTFDIDNRVKTRRLGIQGGVDYGFGGARVGVTGGVGSAKTVNDLSSRLKANGWNAGLYGQFGGLTGFHGSALVKYDSYKLRFTSGAFDGEGARLRAKGADGSLGYRFAMGGEAMIDAKVGLSHVSTKVGDIDAFGFDYDYGRIKSTRGRAGVRATFAGNFAPYIDASIHHEFDGKRNLRLFDGLNGYDLGEGGKGTWGRIEAGLTGRDGPGPIVGLWADVGDKRGFGARAGFRFGGRPAEMIAPPMVVAPPPPPPIAMQTCNDGAVILASDTCPLPPPPPPAPVAVPQQGERG
ncbi:MAG: autotransporter outer membrane beta-barrel domain-containing protein, partial [Paracoccaceae bacterium]